MSQITTAPQANTSEHPAQDVPTQGNTAPATAPATPTSMVERIKTMAMASPHKIGLRPVQIRLSMSEGYLKPVYPHPSTGKLLWTANCIYDQGEKAPDGRTVWYTQWKVCLDPRPCSSINPPRRNLLKNEGNWVWISPEADAILSKFTNAFSDRSEMTLSDGMAVAESIFADLMKLPDCIIPETFIDGFGKPSDSRFLQPSRAASAPARRLPTPSYTGATLPTEHVLDDGGGY